MSLRTDHPQCGSLRQREPSCTRAGQSPRIVWQRRTETHRRAARRRPVSDNADEPLASTAPAPAWIFHRISRDPHRNSRAALLGSGFRTPQLVYSRGRPRAYAAIHGTSHRSQHSPRRREPAARVRGAIAADRRRTDRGAASGAAKRSRGHGQGLRGRR
ncbi:hypothetical protein WOLCODRAFT_151823, partial [Wolfiporia cocos MD-104 SS10]